jgi:CheY-like chemotaxis protein
MEDALENIHRHLPQVLLVDIGLPGMSGIEGITLLKERHPQLLHLMLTVYDDDDRIMKAFCAGACGYLLKKTPPARLLESIREVVSGGAPMSPEIARRVVALFRTFRPPERSDSNLTPHEHRILTLLVDGHNYKTLARSWMSASTRSRFTCRIYSCRFIPSPRRLEGASAANHLRQSVCRSFHSFSHRNENLINWSGGDQSPRVLSARDLFENNENQ